MAMCYCENCFGKKFSVEQYREFMFNEENSRNCNECPENVGRDADNMVGVYPCGQYHCWVDIHNRDEQTSPYHKNPLDDEWDDDDNDDYPYNTKDGEDYLN